MGLFRRTRQVDIFFVGCDGTDLDRGIYSFYIDVNNGEIIKKQFVKSLANPICICSNGRFVNITYRNGSGRVSDGGVWQYACMELQLGLTARASNEGKTYIKTVTNEERTRCYAIDYYNGELCTLKIVRSKIVDFYKDSYKLTGSSIDPIKQTESHPSDIMFTPDGKKLIVLDTGGDEIVLFDFDENDLPVKDEAHSFKVTPGSGPKKMIFNSKGTYAYVINEISSMIDVYKYEDGQFTKVQEVLSYLTEEFSGENTPTDIVIDSIDRYVLVTNKGDDTLVVFAVNPDDGTIERVDCIETDEGPRCLEIFRDRWVIVASKLAGTVESFEIKEKERKGIIFETHSSFALHGPVCTYKGKEDLRVVT